jgi:adenosylhomocysteine nucleosidase
MELAGTTTILVALKAEAQPLIDHYRLKNIHQRPFPIYSNQFLKIVITGVGAYRSAAALSYTAASYPTPESHIWINFGIAGHKSHPIGTAISASKVINKSDQRSWYPNLVKLHAAIVGALTTHDRVVNHHTDDTLCDMEAAGFMSAASSLSIKNECLFVFKIVSDNEKSKAENVTKNLITKVVRSHIPTLEKLIEKAEIIVRDARYFSTKPDEDLLERWHFSQTQKKQLIEIQRRFAALDKKNLLSDTHLDACVTAKDVITKLNQRLQQMLPKF